jgi:hypothetical protein
MGEHKIGGEFDKADRLAFWLQHVKKFLSDNQITMTIKPPTDKELGDVLTKTKKKAQIYAVFDLPLLWMEVRIPGAKPFRIGAKDLDSLRDNAKQQEVMNKLADTTKLVTRAEVIKWHDTHYTKDELDFWRGTLSEMTESQTKLKTEVTALKAFKWGVDDPKHLAQLHAYTKPRSWEHYLQFVDDIDAKIDDKKIFDKYVRPGAAFPVNLGPLAAPLAKQLAANQALDFKPARALIVKLIDSKFIGDLRKDALPPLDKELTRLNGAIPKSKSDFVKAGGTL